MSASIRTPQSEIRNELPVWQQLTGFQPDVEAQIPPPERRKAIRELLKAADAIAIAEFELAAADPEGVTVFWDPVEAVCRELEISRTKLSAFSREVSGLRAHERTDAMKAHVLPRMLRASVEKWLSEELYASIDQFDSTRLNDKEYRSEIAHEFSKKSRQRRKGFLAAAWAVSLGYPNPSRLKKACLVQFKKSLDHMEFELIENIVQKFFDELCGAESPLPLSERADAKRGERGGKAQVSSKKSDETPPKEPEMTPERTGVS